LDEWLTYGDPTQAPRGTGHCERGPCRLAGVRRLHSTVACPQFVGNGQFGMPS